MKNVSFIGLGSNLDDKIGYITAAIKELNNHKLCRVVKVSSLYETKPYGNVKQDNFINGVLELETELSVKELFLFTKEIEKKIGRKFREKWGPREIDLDVLFYNDLVYSDEKLNIPHKDVLNRDFVLVPLAEIEPELYHPVIDKKINEIDISQLESNILKKIDYQFM